MNFNKTVREFEYGPQLLRNAIRTPDGTILESTHRHDFRTHEDANGEHYMVDGGLDYLRGSVNNEPATAMHVYVDEDHEINREFFHWTSFGKDGNGPRLRRPVKDLDTDHIEAILETQKHIPDWVCEIFEAEMERRK